MNTHSKEKRIVNLVECENLKNYRLMSQLKCELCDLFMEGRSRLQIIKISHYIHYIYTFIPTIIWRRLHDFPKERRCKRNNVLPAWNVNFRKIIWRSENGRNYQLTLTLISSHTNDMIMKFIKIIPATATQKAVLYREKKFSLIT